MPTKVKFLKDHVGHKAGEEAELDIAEADPLEEKGVVEFVTTPSPTLIPSPSPLKGEGSKKRK